jgi:hypothetical protein
LNIFNLCCAYKGKTPLVKLDLRASIVYAPCQLEPKPTGWVPEITENEEFLLCFELDPVQSQSIEPDRDRLLGPLLFNGRKLFSGSETGDSGTSEASSRISLPEGEYLFVQRREKDLYAASSTEEWLDLAVEQQKDGLWEQYKLEYRLYVRLLFEDGMWVTQLFRPLTTN